MSSLRGQFSILDHMFGNLWYLVKGIGERVIYNIKENLFGINKKCGSLYILVILYFEFSRLKRI